MDKLIEIFIEAQGVEAALDAIDRICDRANAYTNHETQIGRKIDIWHMLLENLALAGKHEQLLYVLYHVWLGIYSREDAIQCLPFVSQLILLNVEIGQPSLRSLFLGSPS